MWNIWIGVSYSLFISEDIESSPQGALCKYNHGWNGGMLHSKKSGEKGIYFPSAVLIKIKLED